MTPAGVDPLAHLRSLCIEQPRESTREYTHDAARRTVHIPVLVWSVLLWLDGFVVGVALMVLLSRR